MKAKNPKNAVPESGRKHLSRSSAALLILAVMFLLPGILIFGWYGLTCIPVTQSSEFPAKELSISYNAQQCILEIPGGTLTLSHPRQAAVGCRYRAAAQVRLNESPRISSCTGGLPNWNINAEAQTAFVGAAVEPFAAIRQPAVNRNSFSFEWTFTPEEPVSVYQSHFWLRMIVSQQDQTIERWNMLVRDFPMENTALFGQPTVLWFITGGVTALLGFLLLILFFQRERKKPQQRLPE